MLRIRKWIWLHLIYLADRICPEEAFRCSHLTVSLKRNVGWILRKDGVGRPVWMAGEDDGRQWEGYEES